MKKQLFYFSELSNKNSLRSAEIIYAYSLSSAKRIASKKQCFQGTVLELAYSVNNDNFITNPITQKIGNKWINLTN